MKILYFLLTLFVLRGLPLSAQEPITERVVLTGLDTPWEILWGPDNWIWMTERGGRVSRVNPETGEHVVVRTITDVVETGEAGLLGMALNQEGEVIRVYLVYTYRDAQQRLLERLVRYDYNGTTLINDEELLSGIRASGNHNGSRLAIVGDKLFMTTGDAETMPLAQDHTSPNGKILRMNLDGSAPSDNPYGEGAYPANLFWTTGHRNPQGLVYASSGILYSTEHGPTTNDEINIVEKNGNYGWPTVHGLCDQPNELGFCADSSVVEPIIAWTPTIAPAGVDYYDSRAIPEWENSLLFVTLKEQDLRRLKLSADGRTIVDQIIYYDRAWGRLRDLCISPDGRVYLATSNRDGRGNPEADDDRIIELRTTIPRIGRPILSDSVFCSDDSLTVRFTAEGAFASDNVFTVQMSSQTGSFDTLVVTIGQVLDSVGGEVRVPLPGFGRGMRIRIVASNPPDTSEVSDPALTVWWRPWAGVSPSAGKLCGEGDSVVLTASLIPRDAPIVSVVWSTGDTGTTLFVRETGTYFVTAFDSNGCSSPPVAALVSNGVIPEVELLAEKLGICEGDSLLLEASGFGARSYEWSTGEQGRTIWVHEEGTYWVEGTSEDGCVDRSEEVSVVVLPYPPKPGIDRQQDTLIAPGGFPSYQWYKNGTPLLNGRERRYVVTTEGIYAVGVRNEAECETLSDPFEFLFSGVDIAGAEDHSAYIAVHPHPVDDRLRIEFGEGLHGSYSITLTDVHGSRVLMMRGKGEGEHLKELPVRDLPAGPYVLRIETVTGQRARMIMKR